LRIKNQVLNLPSALAGKAGHVFRSEYLTYRAVFDQVYVFPRQSPGEPERGSPAWWQRPRNVFLAATVKPEPLSCQDLVDTAKRLWGHLGRPPHNRVDTELFALTRHAANLMARQTLEKGFSGNHTADAPVDFRNSRVLTDDFAPVDTLGFQL
jgi:hypothetical protein